MSIVRLRVSADWEERGLCRQVDPDLFYPEKGETAEAAKSICQRCEVRPQCLKTSLENAEPYGVWGGVSEPERRKLLRLAPEQRSHLDHWITSRIDGGVAA